MLRPPSSWRRLSLLGGVAALLISCTPESCPEGQSSTEQGCVPTDPREEPGDTSIPPSQSEPGDTPATALRVERGYSTSSFQDAKDVDVFAFSVTAGHVYRFRCQAGFMGYQSACVMRRLSSSGEPLAAQGPEWERGFKAEADGTAYMEVRRATFPGEVSPRFPQDYGYWLEDVGPADDNNTPETATVLSSGQQYSIPAQIELPGDVDYFSFTAEAGHIYQFRCESVNACELRLSDASGRQLAMRGHSLHYRATEAGRYTIRLNFTHGLVLTTFMGPYEYRFFDHGLDDHGNVPEGATPLTLGTPVAGRVERLEDRDQFSFTVPGRRVIRASCSTGKADDDEFLLVGIKDTLDRLLRQGSRSVTYVTPSGDPLVLEVMLGYGYPASVPRDYSCQVEDLGSS